MDQRVIALVAQYRDLDADEVEPDLTLLDDLGMDGDDAVEFFAAFEAEFPSDLKTLYADWSTHFGPEGWTTQDYARTAVGVVLLAIPAGIVGVWAGWPEWAAASAGVSVFFLWFVVLRMWPFKPRQYVQIAVSDLIATAEAGRWSPQGVRA